MLGSCKSLWFESWWPTAVVVVLITEQAFNAVNGFRELGAHDMWTGNRSMLFVSAVSEIPLALFFDRNLKHAWSACPVL